MVTVTLRSDSKKKSNTFFLTLQESDPLEKVTVKVGNIEIHLKKINDNGWQMEVPIPTNKKE